MCPMRVTGTRTRAAARITAARLHLNQAHQWAMRMLEIAERDPKSLILVIADMARSNPPMVGSFVAELARRLQGQSAALALPLTWIEQRLSESGFSIEQLVQRESEVAVPFDGIEREVQMDVKNEGWIHENR